MGAIGLSPNQLGRLASDDGAMLQYMRTYVMIFVILGGAWLTVVAAHWAGGCQDQLGPVGDALSPVGSMLTALALLFAFKTRHVDADRAHLDKLADSYAAWFSESWKIASEAIEELDVAIALKDMATMMLAIKAAYGRERQLRTAATPLLMVERSQMLSDLLKRTYRSFPSWEGPVRSEDAPRFREFAANLAVVLRERRDDIERLLQEAGVAMAAKQASLR